MGSYWALKRHPASSQGDHWDRVHSDQMVLAMIRQGRLVRWSKAQRRPRVSKLRAKGLSGCHPSGQQLRQPDGGPGGQIKAICLKKQGLSSSDWKHNGQKQPAKESTTVEQRKRRLLYALILKLQKGVMLLSMRM